MKRSHRLDGESELESMLSAIAHDLSLPLLQIKSKADLGLDKSSSDELKIITQSGLKLIESYLIALDLRQNNNQMALEPASIGSVLNDSAHQLSQLARLYKTKIEVNIGSRSKPILTNKRSLQNALFCLGASLIRSQANNDSKNNLVVFAAHANGKDNMLAGVYADIKGLSDKELFESRKLAGRANQPFTSLPANNSGGILIADMLLSTIYQPLKASRYKELNGFATQFPISKQLRLV